MNSTPATAVLCGRLWPAFALVCATIHSPMAMAQNSLFSATPSTSLISPVPATRGDIFGPSNLPVPSSPSVQSLAPNSGNTNTTASIPMVPAGQVALALSARFGKDALPISGGLTWRVYGAKADANGNFKLVK
ncbi:MAG: hypothetical protein WCD56_13850, partial [Pseudolabrys sp.]